MNKAYSLLNVKAIKESADEYVIEGVASTPVADRMGDVVEPLGAKFKLPMPLLWQHQSDAPVGRVEFARPTKDGIPYRAHLPKVSEAGRLKDRVDEAIQSIKYRLVAAVSIGFDPVVEKMERLKAGGWRIKEWEWLELSLVTIPANPEASITGFKSFDAQVRAALGNPAPVVTSPASAGSLPAPGKSTSNPKGTGMKTLQEQLAELREVRTVKQARAQELVEAAKAESRDMTDDESTEVDGLLDEVKHLDGQIRMKSVEAMSAATAKGLDGDRYGRSTNRGPTIIVKSQDPDDAFPGQSYVRQIIAKAIAYANGTSAENVAQHRWGKTHPKLVQFIKADVAGGGAGSGEWGAELIGADNRYTGDFINFLYGMTLFDRLPMRSVPANVTVKGQDGAATGYWVGESKGIPASKADFSAVSLTPLKVAALAVLSNELIRDSSPSAEMLVRDSLAEASAQRVDTTFLSTSAASAGVSPAGLLNGLTANTSSGTDLDGLVSDITGLYAYFQGQKNTGGLALVMRPQLAMQIRMLRNSLGMREYPEINPTGGTLEGMPVYTGDNVGDGDLIMLKPSDIWKIGDGGVSVSVSREATIEQSDAPTGATDTPVAMSTKFTNMFQEESTAIKIVRSINFAKRRSTAVAYIGDATYGAPTSV